MDFRERYRGTSLTEEDFAVLEAAPCGGKSMWDMTAAELRAELGYWQSVAESHPGLVNPARQICEVAAWQLAQVLK
jgi:hypothetical protein